MDIFVPAQYSTIQAAINAASSGDTIIVAPGVYYEGIKINKALTLKSSDGPAITTINGNSATENYYVVQIEASDVTIDGFTITNPIYNSTADASGVVIGAEGKNSNIQICNNIIHDIGLLTRTSVSFGTFGVNCGPVDDLLIKNNTIYNIGNDDPNAYSMGIFVWGNGPEQENVCNNITIQTNKVYDIFNPGIVADGINLGGDCANAEVHGNTINSSIKRGIVTNAYMDGGASITKNVVTSSSSYGILLRSPYLQILSGNSISNCNIGIQMNDTSASSEIHGNDIYNNTNYGLYNSSANSANATCNWWGSIKGPNMPGSDKVYGNAAFLPWLNASILNRGQCVGGYGTEGKVNGGGSIISPAGAYIPDSSISGKADFNFEFKYDEHKMAPKGHLDFNYKKGRLKLHSDDIQWIAIENNKAYCYGAGKVNNIEGYTFQLTVIDSDKTPKKQDKLHLKIWDSSCTLVYDNEPETPILQDPTTIIDEGNIVIHHLNSK